MARTMHVKKAQQRYKTKPVIDPATGEPKRTPVMKGDKQKTTKRGTPVFMSVTERDLDNPLPPYQCDSCHQPIEIGTPYKYIDIKTSTYGSRKLTRHESCPQWKIWEYSSSWSARVAQATDGFSVDEASSPEEVQDILDGVASAIKELAEESATSAQSMEEGFGHSTSSSDEAAERAENLENWADEIEGVDIPDLPDPEPRYFVTHGDGEPADLFETDGYDSEEDAKHALSMHRMDNNPEAADPDETEDDDFEVEEITPEDPSTEQIEEWRSEVEDACSVVYESPV